MKDGARLAAVQIALEPGWKTYWRQPGASGVPPRFDFSKSENVESASVSYPAPERNADEDGVTNVYHGVVTLPVHVRPVDPAAPVTLRVVADYGVCERICVPAHTEAELELAPDGGRAGPA
ncbi:protein-disulfide reductase DsbD domain-containing protein, partial [Hansschlegelia beijingensis]